MGLVEDRIEKKRKTLLALLKYNDFSQETEELGDKIYAKNGVQIILGQNVTYISGSTNEEMDYD